MTTDKGEWGGGGEEKGEGRHLSRWGFEAIFAGLALLAVALVLSIVGRHAGWPRQQLNDPVLTGIYAAHFRQFDFFPIWSSSDAYGMGSPIPLYYSRLFFSVSGGIYLLFGNIKLAMVLSTAFFMAVGVYGMRLALSTFTQRRLLIVVGAIGLIFTNYSFTDWLMRGDFGEFSAMMLVPWLVWWCLNLVTTRRASLALIPIGALLIYAHLAIAVDSVIVLCIALIVFVALAERSEILRAVRRLAVSAVGVGLLLSPLIVVALEYGTNFDPASKITELGLKASQNFIPISQYFYSQPISAIVSTQIDYAIWIPISIAIAAISIALVIAVGRMEIRPLRNLPVVLFTFGSLVTLGLLQLRFSRFLYDAFEPIQDTQFPWRMLALITPIGIVAVILIGDSLLKKTESLTLEIGLPLAWLISLIALSPVFSTISQSSFTPIETLPHQLQYGEEPLLTDGYNGEYLPVVQKQNWLQTLANYQYLFSTHREAEAISTAKCAVVQRTPYLYWFENVPLTVACNRPAAGCTVHEPRSSLADALQMRLLIACDRPTDFALPVSTNSLTTVSIMEPDGKFRTLTPIPIPTDPRLVVRISSTKPQVYLINMPTIWGAIF